MNTAAVAKHLNIVESAIVRIEEWANVLFCVVKGIGARFVSKKVIKMKPFKKISKEDREKNMKNGVDFSGWSEQILELYEQMKAKGYEVSYCGHIAGTDRHEFCARGDFDHYELMEQFAYDAELADPIGKTRIYPVGTKIREKWFINISPGFHWNGKKVTKNA